MQDSPTSVTAPHASLRYKKTEADEGLHAEIDELEASVKKLTNESEERG